MEVHDKSGSAKNRYKASKQIRFETSMLRLALCDYSDAYIVVKGDFTLAKTENGDFLDVRNRLFAFKNNAPFIDCILKINDVLIKTTENLHVVTPMYNLLDYSKNYRKTSGSSQICYRDEPNYFPANSYYANLITNSEYFK